MVLGMQKHGGVVIGMCLSIQLSQCEKANIVR